MGRYSKLIHEIEEQCDHEGRRKELEVSLKVLDVLDENTTNLPVKHALMILDDAKSILLQLVGIN